MMNFFSKNFYLLRKQSGKTQAQTGVELGKGQTTIGNWENDFSQPNLDELVEISNLFGVDCETLLKTNLENVQLSNPMLGEKKKAKSTPKSTPNSTPIGPFLGQYADHEGLITFASERDESAYWILVSQIRKMSEDIEQLRLSVDSIKSKKK